MKNRVVAIVLFFLTVITSGLTAKDFPLGQLKHFADGLNIEGGTIYDKYLRQEQIWSNLCIVLDRPFEDGIEWQELTNSNTFPLKEATILDYNETQVNFIYATVMHYYITNAHKILDKPLHQTAKILIQVHRNTSGPRHIELLEQLLCQCSPDLEKVKQKKDGLSKYELFSYFFPDINVQVDYCYGVAPENLGKQGKYSDVDIVLSFSLVAGLHPNWKSGSLLIPDQHIPFYLKDTHLALDGKYFVKNHLNQILCDLIRNQNDEILNTVNTHFYSLNPQKRNLRAKKLIQEDFKNAVLLQVDDLFNPSQLSQTFKLETPPLSDPNI